MRILAVAGTTCVLAVAAGACSASSETPVRVEAESPTTGEATRDAPTLSIVVAERTGPAPCSQPPVVEGGVEFEERDGGSSCVVLGARLLTGADLEEVVVRREGGEWCARAKVRAEAAAAFEAAVREAAVHAQGAAVVVDGNVLSVHYGPDAPFVDIPLQLFCRDTRNQVEQALEGGS